MDIKTLIYLLVLSQAVAAFGMLLASRQMVAYRGFRLWSLSFIIIAVGMALVVLRGTLPPLLSTTLANALILIALSFFHEGTRRFHSLPGPSPLAIDLVLIAYLVIVTLPLESTLLGRPHPQRTVYFGIGYFLVCLNAALRPLLTVRRSFGQWIHSVCFLLLAGVALLRVSDAMGGPLFQGSAPALLQANIMLHLVTTTLQLAGCLLLCHGRALEGERQATGLLQRLNRTQALRIKEEVANCRAQEKLLAYQARHTAMGEMLGAIAHQWRQPLSTVGLVVQSIRKAFERGRLDAAFMERADQDARSQIQYMSDTIDTFRGFFRPEKTRLLFSPGEVLQEVVSFLQPQFALQGIAVVQEIDAGPLSFGYPNELKQVLMNLAANARDALEAGGGSGPRGAPRLGFRLRRSGSLVVIEVADNGGGVADDVMPHIFEPYFTTKGESNGTGIGLYLCRMLVEESMGGRLSCKNARGGALFRIELEEGHHV